MQIRKYYLLGLVEHRVCESTRYPPPQPETSWQHRNGPRMASKFCFQKRHCANGNSIFLLLVTSGPNSVKRVGWAEMFPPPTVDGLEPLKLPQR